MNGRHHHHRSSNSWAPGKLSKSSTSPSSKQFPPVEAKSRPSRIYYPETPSSDGSVATLLATPFSVTKSQDAPPVTVVKKCTGQSPIFPGGYGPTLRSQALTNPVDPEILTSRLEKLSISQFQAEAEKEEENQRILNMPKISRFRKVRKWLQDPGNYLVELSGSASYSVMGKPETSSGHPGTDPPPQVQPSSSSRINNTSSTRRKGVASSSSSKAQFASSRKAKYPVVAEDTFIITRARLANHKKNCGYQSILLTYLAQYKSQ